MQSSLWQAAVKNGEIDKTELLILIDQRGDLCQTIPWQKSVGGLETKINIGNQKMPFMKKYLLSLAAISASLSSFAHEGHGHTHGFTIQHYFVEPEHALAVLAVVAIGVLLFKRYRTTAAKK